jgi:regulator of RNase E activity RraA
VLGLPGVLAGIVPLSTDYRVVGPAFTVQYAAIDADGGTVGDFLDDVPAGAVVVIDNAARADVTVWGGIMTQVATVRPSPSLRSPRCSMWWTATTNPRAAPTGPNVTWR